MRWKDGPVSFLSYLPCFVPSLFLFLLFLLSTDPHGDVPVNKAGLWAGVGIGGSVTHASQAPRLSKRSARVIFGQDFFSLKFYLHNPSLNTPNTHTFSLSLFTHIYWTMFTIRLTDTSEEVEIQTHSTVQFKQVIEDLLLFCGSIYLMLFLMDSRTKAMQNHVFAQVRQWETGGLYIL